MTDETTDRMTGDMKTRTRHPAPEELQALIDGEMEETRAAAVEQHCLTCTSCRQAHDDLVAVYDMLAADPPPEPLRPMWPRVMQGLHPAPTPRFGLSFAVGTSALTAAGIVLGILLGSLGAQSPASQQQDIWSAIGSSIMIESDETLFENYMPDSDVDAMGG